MTHNLLKLFRFRALRSKHRPEAQSQASGRLAQKLPGNTAELICRDEKSTRYGLLGALELLELLQRLWPVVL
jgi:hypothetical protein